jgi:hypothetical protein
MNKQKLDKKIEVAEKYKLDRPKPYAKVEYIHGDRHEVVEFGEDKPSGCELGKLAWFLLGMGWASLVSWVTWWFIRF